MDKVLLFSIPTLLQLVLRFTSITMLTVACCVLQLFVKAGAGSNGVGRPSGGVILDKVLPCAVCPCLALWNGGMFLASVEWWHVLSILV